MSEPPKRQPTVTIYDFDPRALPINLRIAIGTAVAAWAQTEAVMEMAIAGLMGVDTITGASVTTHMPQAVRVSSLLTLADKRLADAAKLDELGLLVAAIREAYEKRNAIAHRSWARDPRTNEIFSVRASAKKRLVLQIVPSVVEAIESDALFIYQAGIDLMGFCMNNDLMPRD